MLNSLKKIERTKNFLKNLAKKKIQKIEKKANFFSGFYPVENCFFLFPRGKFANKKK